MKLPFSRELAFPDDVVTQTLAFLARKGAGKTYAAGKLVELLLELGVQCVVIDTVGNWYGLRIAGDGHGKGFDVVVLGGLRGDIPLEPDSGALVADLVADTRRSFVIDISQFSLADRRRFATAFAERLWSRKKAELEPVPLHLVLEESQLLIPQRVMRGEERMVGVFEEIVRLGRNYGIGVSLISQRPQSVNKEALSQAECLVVLQISGAHERKALREWMDAKGVDPRVLAELPSLPVGVAYIWSPQWLRVLKRVHVGKKKTLDSSATPRMGAKLVRSAPAPLDLSHIRRVMDELAAQREKTGAPSARPGRGRAAAVPAPTVAPVREVVEVPVLKPEDIARLEAAVSTLGTGLRQVEEVCRQLLDAVRGVSRAPSGEGAVRVPEPKAARRARGGGWSVTAPNRTHSPEGDGIALPKGARDMLAALASTLLPSLTRRQLATLAELKATGGTFQKYLSVLRSGGFVEDAAGGVRITAKGLAAIGGRRPAPRSTEELVTAWKQKLPAGARTMLDAVVARHPAPVSREALAAAGHMEVTGGTFQKYLSLLKSNGLVAVDRGQVRAADELFLDRASDAERTHG